MPRDVTFLRAAAVCQALSAVTTLGLIFLARGFRPVTDPIAAAERLDDPVFVTRLVVGVVHPFLVLLGATAVVVLRFHHARAAAATGVVFLTMWATTEAVQQALNLVAVHFAWRAMLANASDPLTSQQLRAYLEAAPAVSDALFLIILIAFVVSHIGLAVAMWDTDRLTRVVAIGFALAAALGVISAITTFGANLLPPGVMALLYPLLQPPARFLTGVWIWREASRSAA
jgi:hypothetical protein